MAAAPGRGKAAESSASRESQPIIQRTSRQQDSVIVTTGRAVSIVSCRYSLFDYKLEHWGGLESTAFSHATKEKPRRRTTLFGGRPTGRHKTFCWVFESSPFSLFIIPR